MPYPFKPVKYHNLTYKMDHLSDRQIKVRTAEKEVVCTVKFSFHCFTDHTGRHLQSGETEDRPDYRDADSNETDRVFCPRRWSWTHWLPSIIDRLSELRTTRYHGDKCTLVTTQRVGPVFRAPYAIYFDVGFVRPDNTTILHVNSAYINEDKPPNMKDAQRFAYLLGEAMKKGKRLGEK
jgi:hypothetical protein